MTRFFFPFLFLLATITVRAGTIIKDPQPQGSPTALLDFITSAGALQVDPTTKQLLKPTAQQFYAANPPASVTDNTLLHFNPQSYTLTVPTASQFYSANPPPVDPTVPHVNATTFVLAFPTAQQFYSANPPPIPPGVLTYNSSGVVSVPGIIGQQALTFPTAVYSGSNFTAPGFFTNVLSSFDGSKTFISYNGGWYLSGIDYLTATSSLNIANAFYVNTTGDVSGGGAFYSAGGYPYLNQGRFLNLRGIYTLFDHSGNVASNVKNGVYPILNTGDKFEDFVLNGYSGTWYSGTNDPATGVTAQYGALRYSSDVQALYYFNNTAWKKLAGITDIPASEPPLGNPTTSGYVLSSSTGGTRSWVAPGGGGSGVSSVNTRTGAVTLTNSDVGLANVPNVNTTNAANLSSGLVPFARVPVGTSSTTVAAGNDSRFPANVSGLRYGNGTSADTAATAAQIPPIPESGVTNLVSDLAGKQALDSDLTAIAALNTTAYGRTLLALADAGAARTYLGTNDANNLSQGTVDPARLPASVPLLDGGGSLQIANQLSVTAESNFYGNTTCYADLYLNGNVSTNSGLLVDTYGVLYGNAGGLTGIPDSALSANVPLLDGSQNLIVPGNVIGGAVITNQIYSNGGDPSIDLSDPSTGYLRDDGTSCLEWTYDGVTIPGTLNVNNLAALQLSVTGPTHLDDGLTYTDSNGSVYVGANVRIGNSQSGASISTPSGAFLQDDGSGGWTGPGNMGLYSDGSAGFPGMVNTGQLEVDGDLNANNDLTVSGNISMGGTLNVGTIGLAGVVYTQIPNAILLISPGQNQFYLNVDDGGALSTTPF